MQTISPPGGSLAKTPFLSSGLARIANPSFDRFHRIAEEAKSAIDLAQPQTPEEIVAQFQQAFLRVKSELTSVNI